MCVCVEEYESEIMYSTMMHSNWPHTYRHQFILPFLLTPGGGGSCLCVCVEEYESEIMYSTRMGVSLMHSNWPHTYMYKN